MNLKNGFYTVQSYHRELIVDKVKSAYNFLSKAKMPLGIKTFVRLWLRNNVLTRDN